MQEWLNWPLSKSGVGQLTEGSNPSLSANKNNDLVVIIFIGRRFEPPQHYPSIPYPKSTTVPFAFFSFAWSWLPFAS